MSSGSKGSGDVTFIIDGREQKKVCYNFEEYDVDTMRKNLDTLDSEGDYTIDGYEHLFAVERKSLNDLTSCCGSRRNHFESQIRVANGMKPLDDDGEVIEDAETIDPLKRYAVVIEAPRWKVEQGAYYSNIHPNSVLGTVNKWPHKFDTLEFYWNENEHYAEVKTYQLLTHWKDLADRGLL